MMISGQNWDFPPTKHLGTTSVINTQAKRTSRERGLKQVLAAKNTKLRVEVFSLPNEVDSST